MKFQAIGLLRDLNYSAHNNKNVRFVRLCVARAEAQRLESQRLEALKSEDHSHCSSSSSYRASYSSNIDVNSSRSYSSTSSYADEDKSSSQKNNTTSQDRDLNDLDSTSYQCGDNIEYPDDNSEDEKDQKSEVENKNNDGKVTPLRIISIKDLPLGPLGNIEFRHNNILQTYLRNEVRSLKFI